MLRRYRIALLVLVVAAFAGPLRGEKPDQGHPLRKSFLGRQPVVTFLHYMRSASVQKELGLSDTQTKQLAALRKNMPAVDGTLPVEEAERQLDKRAAEVTKKLEAILTPKQIDRALEIRTQLGGAMILFDYDNANPDLAKLFKLTSEQERSIRSIGDDNVKANRDGMQAALEDMSLGNIDQRIKAGYLRQFPNDRAANEKIRRLLTPKQLDLLKKLQGKEIDVAKVQKEMDDMFGVKEEDAGH
jgi:hypothetical protein